MTYVFVTGGARVDRISQDVTITDNTFLSNVAQSPNGGGAGQITQVTGTVTTSPNTFGTDAEANIPDNIRSN